MNRQPVEVGEGVRIRCYLADGRILETDKGRQKYNWLLDDEGQMAHKRPKEPTPIHNWLNGHATPEHTDSLYVFDAETLDGSFDTYFINVESQAVIQDGKRGDWDKKPSFWTNIRLWRGVIAAMFALCAIMVIYFDISGSRSAENRILEIIEYRTFQEQYADTASGSVAEEPAPAGASDEDWLEPTPTPQAEEDADE